VKQEAIEEQQDDGQSRPPTLRSIQLFTICNVSLNHGRSQQCRTSCLVVGGAFTFLQGQRMLNRQYQVVETAFVASFQGNGDAVCTMDKTEIG
jgi:hypothetical protein